METIDRLEELDEAKWMYLLKGLSNHESIYGISCSYEQEPYDFIYYFYKRGSNELKERLKKTVSRAVREWELSSEGRDLNVFYASLKLASLTSTPGLSGRLISFAKREFLKNRMSYQHELHFVLLKTLLQLIVVDNLDKERLDDLRIIISRDIAAIEYAAICFGLAWELSLSFGFEKMMDLANVYIKNNKAGFCLYLEIREYIEHYGEKNFCECFLSSYRKMEGQLRREVLLVLLYHLMTRYEEVANLDDIERELRKEGIIRGIDYEERGFSVKSGLLIDDGTLLFET